MIPKTRVGERIRGFRALTGLAEDSGSDPKTHNDPRTHNDLELQFQGVQHPLWPLWAAGMHVVHTHIRRQINHTHKIKI